MAAIWDDPYYSHSDKTKLLVALSIADNARGEDGKAWPSIEYIARKARSSVRGAQEAIQELKRDGKLEVHPFKGVNGTNLYIVNIPPATVAPPRSEAAVKAPDEAADDCTQIIRNRKEASGNPLLRRTTSNKSLETSSHKTHHPLPPLPAELSELSDLWNEWLEHRNEIGKPMTTRAAKATFKLMMDMSEEETRESFDTAMRGGHPNVYPPRSDKKPVSVNPGPARCVL